MSITAFALTATAMPYRMAPPPPVVKAAARRLALQIARVTCQVERSEGR